MSLLVSFEASQVPFGGQSVELDQLVSRDQAQSYKAFPVTPQIDSLILLPLNVNVISSVSLKVAGEIEYVIFCVCDHENVLNRVIK